MPALPPVIIWFHVSPCLSWQCHCRPLSVKYNLYWNIDTNERVCGRAGGRDARIAAWRYTWPDHLCLDRVHWRERGPGASKHCSWSDHWKVFFECIEFGGLYLFIPPRLSLFSNRVSSTPQTPSSSTGSLNSWYLVLFMTRTRSRCPDQKPCARDWTSRKIGFIMLWANYHQRRLRRLVQTVYFRPPLFTSSAFLVFNSSNLLYRHVQHSPKLRWTVSPYLSPSLPWLLFL